MIPYMDYVQNAFYEATEWNQDNSYATLTATARALLDFPTPRGLRMNLSSLSSPNFATSYGLGNFGVVDGSVSYLSSSLPLTNVQKSCDVDLHTVTQGYRQLQELRRPDDPRHWEIWQGGTRVDGRNTLLYGKMYLPTSMLEALYLRRMTPTTQFRLTAVSDSRLKSGGTILAMFQQDVGKWCTEYLYGTDGALIGARGLYNFGRDPRKTEPPTTSTEKSTDEKSAGMFSAGAEFYYGILNKSAGMSTGFRYITLPTHPGTPVTMTLTLSPLMGHLSATYAIRAGTSAAFCSRFEFNMYSYESDLSVGCELWRRRSKESLPVATVGDLENMTGNERRAQEKEEEEEEIKENFAGVLKARFSQNLGIGLLWEGRIKHLLFSVGASIDLKRRDQPFKAVGLELQYSS